MHFLQLCARSVCHGWSSQLFGKGEQQLSRIWQYLFCPALHFVECYFQACSSIPSRGHLCMQVCPAIFCMAPQYQTVGLRDRLAQLHSFCMLFSSLQLSGKGEPLHKWKLLQLLSRYDLWASPQACCVAMLMECLCVRHILCMNPLLHASEEGEN